MDINKFVSVTPHPRQVAWQKLGFTAFIHFGVNTFTNKEWGDGSENPMIFTPTNLNTDQWCEAFISAGITACIITAKHHDGFCLFDTAHTNHNSMNSPAKADVVASLSESCKKYGLKLGAYLSPWDRHEPSYGSGKNYDDFFCAQLEEITTKYGPLYSLWFDGACGEGLGGKRQTYDWQRYYDIIRKNQPDAVISVCGPDVRWIGNEGGHTRPSEWSVVPARLQDREGIAAASQQSDSASFRERPINSTDEDLGSREFLQKELDAGGELCWYPAEVDVSIRPGWFYHPEEDDKVRSLENLLDIYEKSVGGNALLLLNIPPDKAGQISPPDVTRLNELGDRIKNIYSINLLENATATSSDILKDDETYWEGSLNEAENIIKISLPKPETLTHIVLCEQIRKSQRVEAFTITAITESGTKDIYQGTTIGFKKICCFTPITATELQLKINKSRLAPTLRFVGAYNDFPGNNSQ